MIRALLRRLCLAWELSAEAPVLADELRAYRLRHRLVGELDSRSRHEHARTVALMHRATIDEIREEAARVAPALSLKLLHDLGLPPGVLA